MIDPKPASLAAAEAVQRLIATHDKFCANSPFYSPLTGITVYVKTNKDLRCIAHAVGRVSVRLTANSTDPLPIEPIEWSNSHRSEKVI